MTTLMQDNAMHNCFNIDSTGQLRRVFVSVDQYAQGGIAVGLRDVVDGEPYATVSIHVHGVRLAADEFIFKTYSENDRERHISTVFANVSGFFRGSGIRCCTRDFPKQ